MKANELRKLSTEELTAKEKALKEELFNLSSASVSSRQPSKGERRISSWKSSEVIARPAPAS